MSASRRAVLALASGLLLWGCDAASGPGDVVLSDPGRAVADARRMIVEARADSTRHRGWIEPAALPLSLRIPRLDFAMVHADHVDLVLARNPDWTVGARIWSLDARREHADAPTAYPDVYFFDFTNDAPESPANIH
ncbi:MAG TPA: hypothetical protein VGA70_10600 [Longimicrobiales bacterium]|jgi:hypothetical protein